MEIVETEIDSFEHTNGKIQNVLFRDNSRMAIEAFYTKTEFVQHSDIPISLGCELTEQGLIKVDMWQKTSAADIFASGDNSSFLRSVASSVSTGSMAGAAVNKELVDEEFYETG